MILYWYILQYHVLIYYGYSKYRINNTHWYAALIQMCYLKYREILYVNLEANFLDNTKSYDCFFSESWPPNVCSPFTMA